MSKFITLIMQLQEKHSDILLNCISYNLAKMLKQRNE